MKIDRNLWRPNWQEGRFPPLPCPHCGAPLNIDDDSLVVKSPAHNIALVDLTDIDDALSQFSVWFVCGYSKCGQAVAVSGSCTYQYTYDQDGKTITERIFHPKAMHPSPPLVKVHDEVPQPIRDALKASFDLFWLDGQACANRLRVVLELILENQGFPATSDDGRFVPLHNRIENWHHLYGALSIAQSLMAIKWLGNVASHDTGIPRKRLLDAYEILSRLLRRLFPPDERYIDELADEIVNAKGRPD